MSDQCTCELFRVNCGQWHNLEVTLCTPNNQMLAVSAPEYELLRIQWIPLCGCTKYLKPLSLAGRFEIFIWLCILHYEKNGTDGALNNQIIVECIHAFKFTWDTFDWGGKCDEWNVNYRC